MYKPSPLDTSSAELPSELDALLEALAKNVHEVWAEGRLAEGWRYGHQRSDEDMTTPCLVPYEQLPDQEREYDRATAQATLRFIIASGFDIVKR